ncbi:MAG: PAS domain S-box protein [Desulfuromusa sp.]|jgi:PAS domain S-box-containing protein|nr:PAS domain S-box protein [Desulfuromusa sp.]
MPKKPTYEELEKRVKQLEQAEKETNALLQESVERYKNLFDNMLHEVHLWELVRDKSGEIKTWRLVDANPPALNSWGKTLSEVLGKTTDEIFPNSNARELFTPIVEKIFSSGKPHTWERYFPDTNQYLYMTSVPIGELFLSTGVDISNQRQRENALKKSEDKFRTLAETSPLAIYASSGSEDRGEYINPAYTKLFGYTLEEVPTVNEWWPLAYPDENYRNSIMGAWQKRVENAIATKSDIEPMETVVTCKDGSEKIISWSFNSVGSQNWTLGLDLTELRLSMKKTVEEKEAAQRYLDIAGVMFCTLNNQGDITLMNKKGHQILGYPEEELIGKNWFEMCLPKSNQLEIKEVFRRQMSGDFKPLEFHENAVLHSSGEERIIAFHNTLLYGKDGVSGVLFSGEDITERKKTEKALIEMKELRDQAEAIAHVGSWSLDLSRNQLTWSDEVYRIFGCEPQSFSANYEIFYGFVHPADRDAVETAYTDSMRKGNDFYEIEHRIIRKDTTEVRYVYEQGIHKRDAEGEVIRSIGMVQDISKRKRTELELIKQKNAYQSILSASHDGFLVVDTQGQILDVNPAYLTLSGYDRDEVLSLNISELDTRENAEEMVRHINQIKEQGGNLFESGHQRKDGSIWLVEVSTTYSPLNGGRFFAFVRDITERKQAQLALQQKNEELEQFAYSVSHDLKSPLITVRTYAGMLRQDIFGTDQQQITEDFNYIDKATNKMQQLLDALLRYSRIGKSDTPEQTQTAYQLVNDSLDTLAGILQEHQVEISTSELPQLLYGNPVHFGQIWQNLIENAVKYRGEQAQLHIKIGATQEGQDVVFYVRDNGMGIAPEHNDRIFNLFSQLNAGSEEGSGLGLALVKKIVSIYQGRIWVESAGPGTGSCFMFTLPSALKQNGVTK